MSLPPRSPEKATVIVTVSRLFPAVLADRTEIEHWLFEMDPGELDFIDPAKWPSPASVWRRKVSV